MSEEELLTVMEVAVRLNVHRETTLRWLRSGRLNGFRQSGNPARWRISEKDLQAFILKRRGQGI